MRRFQSGGTRHQRHRGDERQIGRPGAGAFDRRLQLRGMKLGLEMDRVDAGAGQGGRGLGEGGAQRRDVGAATERDASRRSDRGCR